MSPLALSRDQRTTAQKRAAHDLPVGRIIKPDDATCGPACLRKVYASYGDDVSLETVLSSFERTQVGGTLAVFLGITALGHGYNARIYSYDMRILDPTWSCLSAERLIDKINARFHHLRDEARRRAAIAYIEFLEKGGEIAFDELTPTLFKTIIDRDHPILAGLSATYLYGSARERYDVTAEKYVDDDVAGEPVGHFVVISGYAQWGRRLTVIDPYEYAPHSPNGCIRVDSDRLINSILLSDVTYDAVLLEVWPNERRGDDGDRRINHRHQPKYSALD